MNNGYLKTGHLLLDRLQRPDTTIRLSCIKKACLYSVCSFAVSCFAISASFEFIRVTKEWCFSLTRWLHWRYSFKLESHQ